MILVLKSSIVSEKVYAEAAAKPKEELKVFFSTFLGLIILLLTQSLKLKPY
jgi:hypothetical protein